MELLLAPTPARWRRRRHLLVRSKRELWVAHMYAVLMANNMPWFGKAQRKKKPSFVAEAADKTRWQSQHSGSHWQLLASSRITWRADKTETMAGAIVSMEVVTFEQWMPPVLQSIKSQKEHAISFAQTARRTRDAICITFKADGAQARSQDKVHWNHAAEMCSFIFVFLVDSNWID